MLLGVTYVDTSATSVDAQCQNAAESAEAQMFHITGAATKMIARSGAPVGQWCRWLHAIHACIAEFSVHVHARAISHDCTSNMQSRMTHVIQELTKVFHSVQSVHPVTKID